ncbi:MAG: MFS transporter [Paracoccaceae bacterium]
MREISISRAPAAALSAVGVFWGGFAAYVPDLKAGIGADDSTWGMVMIMSALGGMCAMYMAPRVIQLVGRPVLPVAAVLLAIAAFYPILPSGTAGLAIALFGMGASVSLLDISANVRISVLEERHGLHLMNLNHAMFSFAFAASAWATSLARQAGYGPSDIAPVVVLAVLAHVVLMAEGRGWQAAPAAVSGERHSASLWPVILPAAAILFAAFVCENAAEVWSALHIERTLGGAHGEGGLGPMMLGLTMGIGRMCGQFAASRLGEAKLVMLSAVLGVIGALVIAVAPSQAVVMLGVGLLGLGVAVVVPSANSILGRLVPADQRGFAISRAWMLGFTGFFIGPTLIGLISELTSLRVAFAVMALVMAAIIPAVRAMQRRGG